MTEPLDLGQVAAVAERLARQGGQVLLDHAADRAALGTESKGRRRELVTVADRAAERVVVGGILAQFPEHAVLAEEGVLTQQGEASHGGDWLWLIDPLDGTTNYVHGLPFYGVAMALAHRGVVQVGVVHAPALGHTYTAVRGQGAFRNGARLRVSATAELADALLCTGFSYNRNEPGRDDNSARLARILPHCADLRRFGSAELDLCLVAAGGFDGYWEQYLQPYDVAAGALLVQEAGGRVTDLRGGGDWLFGGSVLASNGRLHDAMWRLVGDPAG